MTEPTTEKLARALREVGAPPHMITKAKEGYYDDYKSSLAFPLSQLTADAREAGLESIAQRTIDGEFDSTKEESDDWARSPEGQATFQELVNPPKPNRAQRRHPK